MTSSQRILEELLSTTPSEPGEAFRSFPAPPGLGIRAFVEGATRLPGLSLRIARDSVPHGISIPKMRGAECTISSEAGPPATVHYRLRASDRAYASVFIELAGRLIEDAGRATSAKHALLVFLRRLAAWARFFDARGAHPLGRSAQLGLIGELLCMEVVGNGAGYGHAVRAWRGPEGAAHDFQTSAGSIEVKVTTSSSPERFRISSERQLDDSVVPRLLLCAVTAQDLPSGSLGVALQVDRLRHLIEAHSPADLVLFEDRLLSAGYAEHDQPAYEVRIAVLHIEFALVSEGFPRVRPADLRPGVFGVSYDISRAALLPHSVPTTLAEELIRAAD